MRGLGTVGSLTVPEKRLSLCGSSRSFSKVVWAIEATDIVLKPDLKFHGFHKVALFHLL